MSAWSSGLETISVLITGDSPDRWRVERGCLVIMKEFRRGCCLSRIYILMSEIGVSTFLSPSSWETTQPRPSALDRCKEEASLERE